MTEQLWHCEVAALNLCILLVFDDLACICLAGDNNTGAGEDEGYVSDQSDSSTQQSKGLQPEPSHELSDDAHFDAATRAAIEASLRDLQEVSTKVVLHYCPQNLGKHQCSVSLLGLEARA